MKAISYVTLTFLLATLLISIARAEGEIVDKTVISPHTYEIGEPIPDRRIAVMDLRVEGEYSEQVRDWLPALIEDRLLREGWTLVVRGQRMQQIQEEHNMPGIKPGTRPPDNELLGATTFLELTARIQVKDIQGLIGYKIFSAGDVARASVDLTGQIVDPATGVLKSSIRVGGSATGLKTALAISIGKDWRIGAGGYNLQGVRETLVGKAADTAATQMIARLCALYPTLPAQRQPLCPPQALQPSSTTITADPGPATILITLPEGSAAKIGDRYGVYRADQLIAEVEIIRIAGRRAIARIISQAGPIQPTDTARQMPVEIKAQ